MAREPRDVAEHDLLDQPSPTKLEAFIRARNRDGKRLKPARIADEAGYTRQGLLKVRMGRSKPSQRFREAVLDACRAILRDPSVQMSDLFDVVEDADE